MKKLHVLVVDDDPGVAGLAQAVLMRAQHEVTVVGTVTEAIQSLRRNCFDVLLTDVLVGDEDGIGVVREMRLMQPSSRIVVMSGGGERLSDFRLKLGTSFGAAIPLRKPFSPKDLVSAIEGAPKVPQTAAPL